MCHSERSEEPGLGYSIRFLAALGMTHLFGIHKIQSWRTPNARLMVHSLSQRHCPKHGTSAKPRYNLKPETLET